MAERIGFIGTGNMGGPMSRNLLRAGYPLVVYDTRPEAMEPLAALGAEVATSPADVGERSDRVITMLPNSQIVEQVVWGPSGLAGGLQPGAVLIDMSASHPSSTKRIAADLARKSAEMLDAPVAGGIYGAADGTLTIMVGGKEEVYQACLPILRVLGKKIYYIGEIGSGHTMKAVNNLMYALNTLGGCEALVLGVKAGLDPHKIIEVTGEGSGESYAFHTHARLHIMPNNFFPPSLHHLHKDVGIATELARELGVPLLGGNLIQEILSLAKGRGMAGLNDSCIIKLIEEAAGVRVSPEEEKG